jgi:hypothetical protein
VPISAGTLTTPRGAPVIAILGALIILTLLVGGRTDEVR